MCDIREMEDRKCPSKITLSCTRFDGKLEVTDADAFRKTLVRGMRHVDRRALVIYPARAPRPAVLRG